MLTFSRGVAALVACLAAGPAFAQGKPLPPPASDVTPPVELTVSMKDGKPVCDPAELRLPADTNIVLTIKSSADTPVVLTAPGQFENGLIQHADGDLIHVESEKGYTIKQNGQGTLRLRTMKAGEETYACTSTRDQGAPFKGKLILVPPAN
ncbi:cupredoxin domain-containing protein [Methylobacterium sp. J-030]|uniref:cupredoxin domain-containing protein n=1 Tax=Methylobacterium sp. J-030 TaxID=2836627 RepID=UPI001FBA7D20|nr:cupredoxin domain-containing protein [Methylobacterium sp. J-030]MCJ2071282.1 cupredoxin domain-containing protein [Methylobacterium sp. J-030]